MNTRPETFQKKTPLDLIRERRRQKQNLKKFIEDQISQSTLDEEKLASAFSDYPIETVNAVLKELFEENHARVEQLVHDFKRKRESELRKLFSRIPDPSLKAICATAEVLNSPLIGGVYFIKNKYNNAIKIGYTSDIVQRFSQLKASFMQIGMIPKLKLICVVLTFAQYARPLESCFHETFAAKRITGEWFDISVDDIYDEILPNTDQIAFIDGVLIDFTDYEREFFKEVHRSYSLNDREIRWLLGLADSPLFVKENRLSKTLKIVEESGIGIYDSFWLGKHMREVGIKRNDSDIVYDFQKLKAKKFAETDWKSLFVRLIRR